MRPRIFEPDIPDEITGEELEKSVRAELLSLSAENAKVVSRHLACINLYMDTDPELAHKHGIAAAYHAGRLARLDKAQEIEMRIVASGARRDLGELDAAVITLTCKELKNENEEWAVRLRYAYADALDAAGRSEEARQWFAKCADVDHEEFTDAADRAAQ